MGLVDAHNVVTGNGSTARRAPGPDLLCSWMTPLVSVPERGLLPRSGTHRHTSYGGQLLPSHVRIYQHRAQKVSFSVAG